MDETWVDVFHEDEERYSMDLGACYEECQKRHIPFPETAGYVLWINKREDTMKTDKRLMTGIELSDEQAEKVKRPGAALLGDWISWFARDCCRPYTPFGRQWNYMLSARSGFGRANF